MEYQGMLRKKENAAQCKEGIINYIYENQRLLIIQKYAKNPYKCHKML